MKERVNIGQNILECFLFLKSFNLQLMSILGRTFSLFALMNKMFLSFFNNFVVRKLL